MAKGEIVITEQYCKGCGLCAHFCAKECIEMSADKVTSLGNSLPVFAHPEKCNACGVCAWMCTAFCIDVYKFVEDKEPAGKK